jgi:hypothetical protein
MLIREMMSTQQTTDEIGQGLGGFNYVLPAERSAPSLKTP